MEYRSSRAQEQLIREMEAEIGDKPIDIRHFMNDRLRKYRRSLDRFFGHQSLDEAAKVGSVRLVTRLTIFGFDLMELYDVSIETFYSICRVLLDIFSERLQAKYLMNNVAQLAQVENELRHSAEEECAMIYNQLRVSEYI